MNIKQQILNSSQFNLNLFDKNTQLFLIFFSTKFNHIESVIEQIKTNYPKAIISGCSTAGEIYKNTVLDSSCIVTGITFKKAKVQESNINFDNSVDSFEIGKKLVENIEKNDLKHLLVFSDGLYINGADLVQGINDKLPEGINVTGGLAGDDGAFKKTFVIGNKEVASKKVTMLAFYGESLCFGFGSYGGWDTFGIERQVTKSEKNVLYMLDDQPALDLYKSYLGDKAKDLPASALLFPISVRTNEKDKPLVRTILGINEKDKSLTFAGNIPEGSYVKLMKSNVDRLISGAEKSAQISMKHTKQESPNLAILISCVGRKMLMKQLIEEEVEAVQEVFGNSTAIAGFYSYGEIAPFEKFSPCNLHNQTMTITTISEQSVD